MDDRKRIANEREFPHWQPNENGGRTYWKFINARRNNWKAKYVKITDSNEVTIYFAQEIYNEKDVLIEIHKKFPEDTGHQKV